MFLRVCAFPVYPLTLFCLRNSFSTPHYFLLQPSFFSLTELPYSMKVALSLAPALHICMLECWLHLLIEHIRLGAALLLDVSTVSVISDLTLAQLNSSVRFWCRQLWNPFSQTTALLGDCGTPHYHSTDDMTSFFNFSTFNTGYLIDCQSPHSLMQWKQL